MSKNKALLIGINYTGTRNELRGCINDVNNILSYLKERFAHVNQVHLGADGARVSDIEEDDEVGQSSCCGCLPFSRLGRKKESAARALHNISMDESQLDVVILTDNQVGLHHPTKKNILNAFHWLTKDATAESHLFMSYSGHGSHQRDVSGDEEDGQDESLVPVDFQKVGCIIDDDVRRHLVDPLQEGCQLRMILDCCHSGTGSDLKYCYRDVDRALHANPRQTETKCDVVCWSGCSDSQTSADAWIDGKFAGALTATFLKIMRDPTQDKSYEAVYTKVLEQLQAGGYTQKAQLSSGKPIDLDTQFDLF